jgi:hypothetical protein
MPPKYVPGAAPASASVSGQDVMHKFPVREQPWLWEAFQTGDLEPPVSRRRHSLTSPDDLAIIF